MAKAGRPPTYKPEQLYIYYKEFVNSREPLRPWCRAKGLPYMAIWFGFDRLNLRARHDQRDDLYNTDREKRIKVAQAIWAKHGNKAKSWK